MIVCCRGIRKDGRDYGSGSSGRAHSASLFLGIGPCAAQVTLVVAAHANFGEVVFVQPRECLACIPIDAA